MGGGVRHGPLSDSVCEKRFGALLCSALKKTGLAVLFLAALVVVLVLAYVGYLFAADHRVEDWLPLEVQGSASAVAETGVRYRAMSYNIGFGAYEPDFSFFMDGGKFGRAFSKARVETNTANILDYAAARENDIYFFQEVDRDGDRSYHVDQSAILQAGLPQCSSVWAENWDSPYFIVPFRQPHGKNLTGLLQLSRFRVEEALRRSLPRETGPMRIADLDRCYSVSRVPVENGRELVLYNCHLSAYTTDGTIAVSQLKMLLEDMAAEYRAGNYALCGGDFNIDLLGDSSAYFGVSGERYSWNRPFPEEMLEGTGICLAAPLDESAPVPTCRGTDTPIQPDMFVTVLDGFLVSENIVVESTLTLDTGFAYSDHNPVELTFRLAD